MVLEAMRQNLLLDKLRACLSPDQDHLLRALCLLALLAVFFPIRYRVGSRVPSSVRASFVSARNYRYAGLCAGTFLFILGLGLA